VQSSIGVRRRAPATPDWGRARRAPAGLAGDESRAIENRWWRSRWLRTGTCRDLRSPRHFPRIHPPIVPQQSLMTLHEIGSLRFAQLQISYKLCRLSAERTALDAARG